MNNNNLNFSDIYTNVLSDGLSALRDSISAAFYPLVTQQLSQNFLDILSSNVQELTSALVHTVLESIDFGAIRIILEDFSQYLPSYDFSSLAKDIVIDNDFVILTDDAVETFTELFNESDENSVSSITSKMSVKDFLFCILIPLLCMLVPMLQDSYYNRLNAIEAQQHQLQEAEYQEAILNLETQHAKELEELNNNLNELLHYLESVQATDSPDANIPLQPSDSQEAAPASLSADCEVDSSSDNQDTSQAAK